MHMNSKIFVSCYKIACKSKTYVKTERNKTRVSCGESRDK